MITLKALAGKIGAAILSHPDKAGAIEIHRVFAGNRMSELLLFATDGTLLVSNLANKHLVRVATLLEAPGICLCEGVKPDEALIRAATESGKVLLVSPADMAETCRRLGDSPVERLGLAKP